jgi:hypothetical protein
MLLLFYFRNFYPQPMHVPYPGSHHLVGGPSMLSGGGFHHYPIHPSFPSAHHHPIGPPYIQQNPLNGFHITHFETANSSSLHHPGTTFAATSTLIAHHHQTATQSIPTSIGSALSKDEFYMKQNCLQRT